MHKYLTLAFCLLLVGCATDPPTPSTPVATAQRAVDLEGQFRLGFELPTNTWKAGAAIEGVATLTLVNGVGVDLGGSGGGVLGFGFAEVNGTRRVDPASSADCKPYRLDAGKPMTSPITKSGGFGGEDPNAAFYQAFLTDPIVRLPAGDWTITAVASFVEGMDCGSAVHALSAPILIHVTP